MSETNSVFYREANQLTSNRPASLRWKHLLQVKTTNGHCKIELSALEFLTVLKCHFVGQVVRNSQKIGLCHIGLIAYLALYLATASGQLDTQFNDSGGGRTVFSRKASAVLRMNCNAATGRLSEKSAGWVSWICSTNSGSFCSEPPINRPFRVTPIWFTSLKLALQSILGRRYYEFTFVSFIQFASGSHRLIHQW